MMEVMTDSPRDVPSFFNGNGTCGTTTELSTHASFTMIDGSGGSENKRVVSVSDHISELAPETSTLEVRSEGNWEGFAPAADTTTAVGTITVPPTVAEDDLSTSFAVAPSLPKVDYFVGLPGVTKGYPGSGVVCPVSTTPNQDFMPVPRFTPGEHLVHKTIFCRLLAKRVAHRTATRVLPKAVLDVVTKNVCECAGRFLPSVYRVENEAFEMMMLRRVQRYVTQHVDVPHWVERYMGAGKCVWPVRDFETENAMRQIGFPGAPTCDVRLVSGFQEHVTTVERVVASAKFSISITTCYLKCDEAHFTRLLCELLPAAAKRGVRVRLLLDGTVARAAIARSNGWGPLSKYASQSNARSAFLAFYDETLAKTIAACPPGSFKVGFFQAAEPVAGYEVKSHVKLFVADGTFAITGGSNLYPMELTQKSDCDIAVNGAAATAIDDMFNEMWKEQVGETLATQPDTQKTFQEVEPEGRPSRRSLETSLGDISVLVAGMVPSPAVKRVNMMSPLGWHAHGVRFNPTMSRPDRHGEDAVLRAVIGLADKAKEELLLCFGFAAPHAPLIDALRRCVLRGVRVRVLLNSQYSADLQTPMGDLALGARALLVAAPGIELWVTGPTKSQNAQVGKGVYAFQHGKFCVADRQLCSVGSWNAWARSAFHEMELNMFFDAPDLAEKLAEKWLSAAQECARVDDPNDLVPGVGRFAPRGCEMCLPFGKFCEDALVRAEGWALENNAPKEMNSSDDL